jgi:hypothetical protein
LLDSWLAILARWFKMVPSLFLWSPVRYVAPVFLCVDLACLWSRHGQWRGVWVSSLDWAGGSLLLLGPLIAGIASWRAVASAHSLGERGDVVAVGWTAARVELTMVIVWASVTPY